MEGGGRNPDAPAKRPLATTGIDWLVVTIGTADGAAVGTAIGVVMGVAMDVAMEVDVDVAVEVAMEVAGYGMSCSVIVPGGKVCVGGAERPGWNPCSTAC